MKNVLVYRADLLHYSETFIKEQLLSYSGWAPTLIGERIVHGIPLDGIKVRLVGSSRLRKFGIPFPAVSRLKSEAATLLHVHFGIDAVTFWPIAKRLDIPVVITLHGYDINIYREHWQQLDFVRNYPDRLLTISRRPNVYFVAVSAAIRQRAIEFGIPADRIVVRYVGIDPSRFSFSGKPIHERRRRVLFVGRFVEKKGGEILIKAYARVRASVPDAELVMVGDGQLTQRLKELAQQLNVPVEFTGRLPSTEVKKQMDEARVFCLPSLVAANGDAEGMGMVILEAQACGVPVVTSARGGATEGINEGVTGLAFAEGDIVALSEHLISLLTDDARAKSMSRSAPNFIAGKFDIHQCTRLLEDFYEEITQEQKG